MNTIREDLELLTMAMGGSPARTYQPHMHTRSFNLRRWLRLAPFDLMVFGRVDSDEYFVGLQGLLANRMEVCMGDIELHIGECETTKFREIDHTWDIP